MLNLIKVKFYVFHERNESLILLCNKGKNIAVLLPPTITQHFFCNTNFLFIIVLINCATNFCVFSLLNSLPQLCFLRVIPQGTVDNNLGPDRLAGPKSLDPN